MSFQLARPGSAAFEASYGWWSVAWRFLAEHSGVELPRAIREGGGHNQGTRISAEQARALSEALRRALADGPLGHFLVEQGMEPGVHLRDFAELADFLEGGAFRIY